MSANANKLVVRRFVHEIFEDLNPAAVDELVSDDFVWHRSGGDGGKDFLRQSTTRMRGALADIRFVINDELAEGDRVAVRLTAKATAKGPLPGAPDATGRSYSIEEIHIFRLRDGRVVEHWHQYDALDQRQQLSAEEGTA